MHCRNECCAEALEHEHPKNGEAGSGFRGRFIVPPGRDGCACLHRDDGDETGEDEGATLPEVDDPGAEKREDSVGYDKAKIDPQLRDFVMDTDRFESRCKVWFKLTTGVRLKPGGILTIRYNASSIPRLECTV